MNDRKPRPSRGLARYLRKQLAAARRSGDPRKIAAAEAEATAARLAPARPTVADHAGSASTSPEVEVDGPEKAALGAD